MKTLIQPVQIKTTIDKRKAAAARFAGEKLGFALRHLLAPRALYEATKAETFTLATLQKWDQRAREQSAFPDLREGITLEFTPQAMKFLREISGLIRRSVAEMLEGLLDAAAEGIALEVSEGLINPKDEFDYMADEAAAYAGDLHAGRFVYDAAEMGFQPRTVCA